MRIVGRRKVGQHFGAARGFPPFSTKNVLLRNRNPRQRRSGASGNAHISCFGLRQSGLLIERHIGINGWVVLLNTRHVGLR